MRSKFHKNHNTKYATVIYLKHISSSLRYPAARVVLQELTFWSLVEISISEDSNQASFKHTARGTNENSSIRTIQMKII